VDERVLVTGAAGFIGMHVARRLLSDGYAVTGLDNCNSYYDPRLKTARIAELRAYPKFRFEKLDLADIGDFRIAHGDIEGSLAKIEEQAAVFRHLVALGGDHTITLALLRALARRNGPVGLVHFDGHVDTWPESFGLVFGHGSPFYHAIEEGLIDPRRTIQIGIRSPLHRDIFDWTIGKGVTIVSAEEVHETGPQAVAARIREVVGTEPAYMSFDVDALDPAFAPGTGTPEVGGLATWQARAILRRLSGLNFTGMDVVEVSPPYDVAEITALAAATMAWDYIALLAPNAER